MRKQLKIFLELVAPGLLDVYRALNNRRLFGLRFRSLHRRTRSAIFKDGSLHVLSGPFKGLKYIDGIVWGPITPKWLGSYECELADTIEEIVSRGYDIILDVGCAEGYYAVGLAYRIPSAQVLAYDTDFISRSQTRRLARLNGLESQVHISRFCDGAEIARHATDKALIVCDIEGFERSLLDPGECAALARFDILVEVHEARWTPSTLDLLKARFSGNHSIQEVVASDRQDWIRSSKLNLDSSISREDLSEAVNEHRENGRIWLWMKAKKPALVLE